MIVEKEEAPKKVQGGCVFIEEVCALNMMSFLGSLIIHVVYAKTSTERLLLANI